MLYHEIERFKSNLKIIYTLKLSNLYIPNVIK